MGTTKPIYRNRETKESKEEFAMLYANAADQEKARNFLQHADRCFKKYDLHHHGMDCDSITPAAQRRIMNLDVALVPIPFSWFFSGYGSLPMGGDISTSITFTNKTISIDYRCSCHDEGLYKQLVNPFRLAKVALSNARRFGLKSSLNTRTTPGDDVDSVYYGLLYEVPLQGNLLKHFLTGREKVQHLFAYAEENIWTNLKKELKRRGK